MELLIAYELPFVVDRCRIDKRTEAHFAETERRRDRDSQVGGCTHQRITDKAPGAEAAQVVGAVAAGFAALGLDGQLGGALTWTDPSPVAVAVGVGFLGLLASWTVLAIDGGENAAWSGLGPVASAAALGVGYVLGGGLFSALTFRLVGLGVRVAAVPLVKNQLFGLAEAAVSGFTGGSDDVSSPS